jgi:hypothetical protein
MHAIEMIASALTKSDAPFPDNTNIETCAITGKRTLCIPRNILLKKGFTNEAILKAPLSKWVSVDAYRVLRYRPERSWSWICNGRRFVKLKKKEVRNIVIGQKYPKVWVGYVTTSYKKHGSLWTRVNSGINRIWRFEALDVDCGDHQRLIDIWYRLNIEIRNGIGKKSMETLTCSAVALRYIGHKRWIDFERWARPISASPLYRFLVYLLPSQKELRDEQTNGMEDTFKDIDFFEEVGNF